MSYAEYLAAEATSEIRHEFLNGEVWAMAGGTPEHAALAAAVIGVSTYPDVAVVCGALETAPDDPDAIANPVVLVEVLSDATEACDRGVKAAHYRQITALKEYVLVSQAEPRVEVYRRAAIGRWELLEAKPGAALDLEALGVRLDVAALYSNPLGGQS